MKQYIKNYVNHFNKFQWWIDGVITGILLNRLYSKIKDVQDKFNPLLVEDLSFYHAAVLYFDLQYDVVTQEEAHHWLLIRDYSFKSEVWDLPKETSSRPGCSCGTQTLTHEIDCTIFERETP